MLSDLLGFFFGLFLKLKTLLILYIEIFIIYVNLTLLPQPAIIHLESFILLKLLNGRKVSVV